MRKFDDLNIFIRQDASMYYSEGNSSFYASGQVRSDRVATNNTFLETQMLYCSYLGKSDLKEFYFQRRRKQKFLSLEYIYSGEICIRSGNMAYVAEAGDLCLLHPNQDHDLLFPGKGKCHKMGIILSGRMLAETLKSLRLEQTNTICLADARRLDAIFDNMRNNLLNILNRTACEALAGNTFELLQMIANVNECQPIPPRIAEIRDYLEAHYAENLNMKTLAASYGMSLPTFNKYFRSVLHATPYQYLIQVRMHRAAYLLAENRLNVKEISAMTGYGSPFHFSSEFRRIHGLSPREYQKKSCHHLLNQ